MNQNNKDELDYKELLLDLMHELRQIGHVLKANSEEGIKEFKKRNFKKEEVEKYLTKIFDNTYIMSLWLDIIDFELDPIFFETQNLAPRSLYGKFYKVKPLFERLHLDKKLKVKLEGESRTDINMYPIIDILPYIILNNYVKYALKEETIVINFDENEDNIFIDISAMCIAVEDEEIEKLFKKGFRSRNVKIISNLEGAGRGLAIVRHIIDIHDAEIRIESGKNIIYVNDIPYRDFVTKMMFRKDVLN